MTEDADRGWSDLLLAISLLRRGRSTEIRPFHCEHDILYVMSNPYHFSEEELNQLEDWGFHADFGESLFYSYWFGST